VGILYGIAIFFYNAAISIAALFNNQKAILWKDGRKNWEIKITSVLKGIERKRIWIHCASLGEFEQGRPVIEALKKQHPSVYIVLSFFSPSGYELRKNYPLADFVCYLPADSKKNARKFIEIVSPAYVIFVKYEFWYNYFFTLKKNKIPLYMISAIFRNSQIFFKWYGSIYRDMLSCVKHFFVQDENSASLLINNGFTNVSITGDTRFDRVAGVMNEKKNLDKIIQFSKNARLIIAGSTWPKDEEILFSVLENFLIDDVKIILAPHEVSENRIEEIISKASGFLSGEKIIRYSSTDNPENAKILVIDNIGILSYTYRYGTVAWIGGGFGKGIHNILEAATFGLPVIFGPEYKKFHEATTLINLGGAFSISNNEQANKILLNLLNDDKILNQCSEICRAYIKENIGATEKILSALPELNS
jgi:3-deoxy-D-manno-octulosonic-acid transferase